MHDDLPAGPFQVISLLLQCRQSYASSSTFPSFHAHSELPSQFLPLVNEHPNMLRQLLHCTGSRHDHSRQHQLGNGTYSIPIHMALLDNNHLSNMGRHLKPPFPTSRAHHLTPPFPTSQTDHLQRSCRPRRVLLPHQRPDPLPFPQKQAQHSLRYRRRRRRLLDRSTQPGHSRQQPHPRPLLCQHPLHSQPRSRRPTALRSRRRQALPHRRPSRHLLLGLPPTARYDSLSSTT